MIRSSVPRTSAGERNRWYASSPTPNAITIKAAPFTSAARISNRSNPNVRSAVTGRCASAVTTSDRPSAATSASMWPASASRASEWASHPPTASATITAAVIASTIFIRRRLSSRSGARCVHWTSSGTAALTCPPSFVPLPQNTGPFRHRATRPMFPPLCPAPARHHGRLDPAGLRRRRYRGAGVPRLVRGATSRARVPRPRRHRVHGRGGAGLLPPCRLRRAGAQGVGHHPSRADQPLDRRAAHLLLVDHAPVYRPPQLER